MTPHRLLINPEEEESNLDLRLHGNDGVAPKPQVDV